MQTLLEFEALWHQAWLQSIDNAKAQLQATLLAENPLTGATGIQDGLPYDSRCCVLHGRLSTEYFYDSH